MSIVLETKNIETYYGLVHALRGISFAVQQGTITTILGNNGAGKSTILKTIMGLVDGQPDKGSISFCGQRIDGQDTENIVRLGLAFVPEGREVFAELSVQDNLRLGVYLCKDRSRIATDIDKIFNYFPELKARSAKWAGTLSGGEQQMLAIGRALMSRPKLLILDEPSLGLSPILVSKIFKIINQINQDNVTILLVEQNARMALQVSHNGFVVENGRIVMQGSANDLLADNNIKEFYLGIRSQDAEKSVRRWKKQKIWR